MIVGILGQNGCGGTFIDWTIQYLSGQTNTLYINCGLDNRSTILDQKKVPLIENPIALSHLKTHPSEYSVDDVIEIFREHTEFELNSFYFTNSPGKIRTKTEYNQLILTYSEVKFITYNFSINDVDAIFCFQNKKTAGMMHSKIPLDQMPKWDQRELMSLYYPKEIQAQITAEKILPSTNNFNLEFSTAIEKLDTVVERLFSYLGLAINKDRYSNWQQIYNSWKNNNSLNFFKELDTIVDAILNNKFHDLSQYNMSFAKEVVIASKLLYNHNLALRAYGKDNLSDNTQQWSDILEPNIYHNLTE